MKGPGQKEMGKMAEIQKYDRGKINRPAGL
jgi:hypothetical protein